MRTTESIITKSLLSSININKEILNTIQHAIAKRKEVVAPEDSVGRFLNHNGKLVYIKEYQTKDDMLIAEFVKDLIGHSDTEPGTLFTIDCSELIASPLRVE